MRSLWENLVAHDRALYAPLILLPVLVWFAPKWRAETAGSSPSAGAPWSHAARAAEPRLSDSIQDTLRTLDREEKPNGAPAAPRGTMRETFITAPQRIMDGGPLWTGKKSGAD